MTALDMPPCRAPRGVLGPRSNRRHLETGAPWLETTTNHDEIRRWADERGGKPASVQGTGGGGDDPGILRIDFAGDDENLEHISWEEWFEAFDENNLALVYQEQTADGEASRFNKLVSRDSAD